MFVHGLMGWGQRAGINAMLPYWGMTTGSLTSYLNSLGYETYSATVGPISSAWDRACELYAQLTGTTVDYGAAHAAAHDHARYGITYDQPLFSGWGTKRAVNLVGHSFGGATTRQFLELMANGSAEEVAAAKAAGTAPSPLFTRRQEQLGALHDRDRRTAQRHDLHRVQRHDHGRGNEPG